MNRNARILSGVIASLLASASLVGCDLLGISGPSGPGELHANIISPDGAVDGAAVIELTGTIGAGTISSTNGRVFYERGENSTRLVVILSQPGLITFQMRVDEVAELPEAAIVQIADGNNVVRPSLSGYEVEWVQLADDDRDFHRIGR